jgi:hypothetical protein
MMVDPTDGHVLSETLNKLGQEPLDQADDETLVSLAHEVWYEHSSVDSELRLFLARDPDEVAARRVGYLLEKLTRFPCATDDRAVETLTALALLSQRFPRQDELDPPEGVRLRDLRDELAVSWGVNEGLGPKIQTLLPYQTRHYAASRNNAFK